MAVSSFSKGTRRNLSRSGYFLSDVGPISHTLEKEKEREKEKEKEKEKRKRKKGKGKKVKEKAKEAKSPHEAKNTSGT